MAAMIGGENHRPFDAGEFDIELRLPSKTPNRHEAVQTGP
jgi:hypothetical protein